MSDLDTMLTGLRDDLRSGITPPDLAHVTARARQRSVRRRMQVGAVVAVVAVSVAVPVLRSLPDADRPPAKPPVPSTMTFQVDFADADHAYALGSDCEDPEGACTLELFASADGGRTWEKRALPDSDEKYSLGELTVLGADRLSVARIPDDEGKEVARIVSTDRGRTWPISGFGDIAAPGLLREDGWVQSVCVGEAEDGGCRIGVGMTSPDGRKLVPAPAQPPLVEPTIGRSATDRGRFWATGIDRATGRWAISVSSDLGATWTTTPVDVPGEPAMNDAWSVVENAGVLYATLQGSIAKGPFGLLAVYRSTDGGTTWTNTRRATPETVLQAMLGIPVAAADGRLLVYSAATGTYESTDGGATFTKTGQQLPGEVMWTRGGYVAKRGNNGYAISTDGLEWRNFGIG